MAQFHFRSNLKMGDITARFARYTWEWLVPTIVHQDCPDFLRLRPLKSWARSSSVLVNPLGFGRASLRRTTTSQCDLLHERPHACPQKRNPRSMSRWRNRHSSRDPRRSDRRRTSPRSKTACFFQNNVDAVRCDPDHSAPHRIRLTLYRKSYIMVNGTDIIVPGTSLVSSSMVQAPSFLMSLWSAATSKGLEYTATRPPPAPIILPLIILASSVQR